MLSLLLVSETSDNHFTTLYITSFTIFTNEKIGKKGKEKKASLSCCASKIQKLFSYHHICFAPLFSFISSLQILKQCNYRGGKVVAQIIAQYLSFYHQREMICETERCPNINVYKKFFKKSEEKVRKRVVVHLINICDHGD